MEHIKKIIPQEGQESVWNYPRPPKLEQCNKHIRVIFDGELLAETTQSIRVLETSHPPVYYIPQEDVNMSLLKENNEISHCEFKGRANYFDLVSVEKSSEDAAWTYLKPSTRYSIITNYIAFYPNKVDACFVDGEKAKAQEGEFYGGWITDDIVGPFKGGAGTWDW